MNCKLIKPSIKYKEDWENYVKEYIEENSEILPLEYKIGSNYSEWLHNIEDESNGENLAPHRVPSTKYFLVNEKNKIVGGISIRHSIDTEYLFNFGGHIGYGIRPSERNKGYGNIILLKGLKKMQEIEIKKVLITCLDSNIYSKMIIEKNGGKLENKIPYDNNEMCRYWIEIGEN